MQEAFNTDFGKEVSVSFDAWMLRKARGQVPTNPDLLDRGNINYLQDELYQFNSDTSVLWDECFSIYNRIANNNPIQDEAAVRRVRIPLKFKRTAK